MNARKNLLRVIKDHFSNMHYTRSSNQSWMIQVITVILVFLVLLAGCAMASPQSVEEKYIEAPAQPMERAAISLGSGDYAYDSTKSQSTERIVIKNASLSIVVDDPVKSMDMIAGMAEEMSGFVVSANMYQQSLDSGAKVPRASITIRIPAEKLNDGLSRIKSESDDIPLSENINSQDVTSEYTDLQSRLRNLENAETQLAEIMKSATKTEDVLKVYNQLVSVREQIEVIKGQIKYYEESAALSAISVDLVANEAVQPLTIGGWQPGGIAKDAIQALINTLKFIINMVIWIIIYLLPVLLVLFLLFVLPIRYFVRRWRKGRPPKKGKNITSDSPQEG